MTSAKRSKIATRTVNDPPFQAIACPSCGSTNMSVGQSLSLKSLLKADEEGWIATGGVELQRCMHGQCANCGYIVDAIRQQVPVSYPSVRCPKCDSAAHLKYEVNQVNLESDPASFRMRISCLSCGKTSPFSRLVSKLKLWSIESIEFGWPPSVKIAKRVGSQDAPLK